MPWIFRDRTPLYPGLIAPGEVAFGNVPPSLVSVIIPVYDGMPQLDAQLEALANQDYDGEFEVIVSDNGANGDLRRHLDELGLKLDVRWVDSSGKRGVTNARNIGIDAARGQFLAFTDHDDAVHPNWLRALVRAAEDFDAVGGGVDVRTLNSDEVATWRSLPPPEKRFETPYLPYACGNNFGMWSRVVDEVGYFDGQFLGGGEDVDYSWRIQEAGLTLGHVPDAVVAYRLRTTLRASFVQGMRYGWTSVELARKHSVHGSPDPSALLQVPAHVATILYFATVRNPWLPRALNPPPRGLWAHLIGQQYGALRMRLQLLARGHKR